MRPHDIDDAHDAILVDNAHLGSDTVHVPTIDGDVVVGLGNAVADDLSHHKGVLLQGRLVKRVGREQLQLAHLVAQLNQFHLQCGVAFLQALVDVTQVEIGRDTVERLIDGGAHRVGRRQIDALLVGIILKQQHEAQYHIDSENEPRTVFDEEVEQIIHQMSF